ncbi:MAG TPA: type VI secretion system tip protein TssI/VgrG [Longimicrobium sp.]|nr:type VI secretion system tip protein TssI/VgrG [Longimicrobium sp.]
MSYTQTGRPMRVETALGADVLLLAGLSGLEGVSRPFSFRLDLVSEDDAVSAAGLLRTPAAVTLLLPTGDERTIHGLVRRFVQEGRREELTSYQAEIVPWLWFLSLSRESRIYQELSVPEIVEQVFRGLGHADFELRCTRPYPKREFCVQYRETHLDFVSRLMEEEGIFYFFEHSPDRHLLVLADDNGAVKPCPGGAGARMAPQEADGEDVVGTMHWEEQACVGKVVLRDYDFLQPSLKLEGSIAAGEPEELYDYPGEFTAPDEGERYARLRLEEAGALRQVARGQSTCRVFQSGFRFDLSDHFRASANQAYTLLQVQHVASAGDYRAGGTGPMEYRNHFVAIPHSVAFRPPRATPHPVVQGSQTALVVGPAGEEVWVDRHGRIKVQFYWDREGKKDENSSCWVRVSQPWAGKGYGSVQIPRIGNEVVVEFLEGDPDRPIVTGCVYNAEQTPPFELPAAGIQMGMKSRSSKGGGGYNEITLTDTKGTELITIHAQYDMGTVVEHDKTLSVGNDESISIGANETLSVEKNRSESIGADDSLSVGGSRSVTVDKDESLDVTGNRSVTVGKDESIDVTGKRTTTITRDDELSVGEKRSAQVGKDDVLQVGKKLVIDAGDEITIKTGDASIVMKKDGTITIKGKDIKLDASGKINGKASGDVVLKGAKVMQN